MNNIQQVCITQHFHAQQSLAHAHSDPVLSLALISFPQNLCFSKVNLEDRKLKRAFIMRRL